MLKALVLGSRIGISCKDFKYSNYLLPIRLIQGLERIVFSTTLDSIYSHVVIRQINQPKHNYIFHMKILSIQRRC